MKKRRFLSAVLAVVMSVTCLPVLVFAGTGSSATELIPNSDFSAALSAGTFATRKPNLSKEPGLTFSIATEGTNSYLKATGFFEDPYELITYNDDIKLFPGEYVFSFKIRHNLEDAKKYITNYNDFADAISTRDIKARFTLKGVTDVNEYNAYIKDYGTDPFYVFDDNDGSDVFNFGADWNTASFSFKVLKPCDIDCITIRGSGNAAGLTSKDAEGNYHMTVKQWQNGEDGISFDLDDFSLICTKSYATEVNGILYESLAKAVEENPDVTTFELYGNVTENYTVTRAITIKRNGFSAENVVAGDGFRKTESDEVYSFAEKIKAEGDYLVNEYFKGATKFEGDGIASFEMGNKYLYVYDRANSRDGVVILSDIRDATSGSKNLKLKFEVSAKTKLLTQSLSKGRIQITNSLTEKLNWGSASNPAYIFKYYDTINESKIETITYDYNSATFALPTTFSSYKFDGIPVVAGIWESGTSWSSSVEPFAIDNLAIYDGDTLIWSYNFNSGNINPSTGLLVINTAINGEFASPEYADNYDLGTITFKVHDSAAGGVSDVKMSIETDDTYFTAKLNTGEELVYSELNGTDLAAGTYTLEALFKNNEIVTSSSDANNRSEEVGTKYFTYWHAGNDYFLRANNNIVNIGAKLYVTDSNGNRISIDSEEDVIAVNSENWTRVKFTFKLRTDSFVLEDIAFTAEHILAGKTRFNSVYSDVTNEGNPLVDYANVAFKDSLFSFEKVEKSNANFGIFALLLIKKKMAAEGKLPGTDKPVETTAVPETTEPIETEEPPVEVPASNGNAATVYVNGVANNIPAAANTNSIGKTATSDNVGTYVTGILNQKNVVTLTEDGTIKVSNNAAGGNSVIINTGVTLPAGTYTVSAYFKVEGANQNMAIFVQNPQAPGNSYINKPGLGKTPIDTSAKINSIGHVETKTIAVGTGWAKYTNTITLAEDTLLVLKVGGATTKDVSTFYFANLVVE